MRRNDETPWGPAQHVRSIADGIVAVSTAGHGGVQLSPERIAEMKQRLGFIPGNFLGCAEWWEEDCDQAIPAIVFSEHYEARCVYHAYCTVKGDKDWANVLAWAEANPAVMAKVNEYKLIVESHWLPGSKFTLNAKYNRRGWGVFMHKGTETKVVAFADYPEKPHYTDEEVSAMEVLEVVSAA